MNSNSRIAATLYCLGTVCLRNISINTLHNGDGGGDDDDDNDNNSNNNYFFYGELCRPWVLTPYSRLLLLLFGSSCYWESTVTIVQTMQTRSTPLASQVSFRYSPQPNHATWKHLTVSARRVFRWVVTVHVHVDCTVQGWTNWQLVSLNVFVQDKKKRCQPNRPWSENVSESGVITRVSSVGGLWFGSGWDVADLPSIGGDCRAWGVFIMRSLGLGNAAFVFISTWLDFTWQCHSAGQMNKFPLRLWGFPNRLLKPSQWINCCLCFNVLRSFPLTS